MIGLYNATAKKIARFFLIAVALACALSMLQSAEIRAQAPCGAAPPGSPYGRASRCGWVQNLFSGDPGYGLWYGLADNLPGSFTALEGVNNVDQFVSIMRYHLNVSGGCNPVSGSVDNLRRRNGAGFIVLTMQGAPTGTAYNTPCDGSSPYHIDNWESLVRQYDAAGLINYNESHTFNINTHLQSSTLDAAWYSEIDTRAALVIRNPVGDVIYAIKRDCANPIGDVSGLVVLDHGFSVTPNANVTFAPSQDAPVNATFATGASYAGAPVTTTYNRLFFYVPAGTTTEVPIQVPSPSPDTRTNTGSSFSYPDVVLNIASLGLDPGDQVCARITVTPAAGTADSTGTVLGVSVPSRDATVCETIVHAPYFQAYGDVRVGSGFEVGGVCSTDPTAGIVSWNSGPTGFTGAGAQLAVFAFDQIYEFASGQVRTNTAKSLTFANANPSNGNYGSGTYGGGLETGNAVCAPDYYAGSVTAADTIAAGSVDVSSLSFGTYRREGDLIVNASTLSVGSGTRIIYVNGDAIINGNIIYGSSNPNYGNVDNIPGMRLIVRGNIYVRPGVSQMDGIYVAQPDPANTGGRFYTCAPGNGPPSAAQINTVCRNKLTVYGAVIADLIKLTRSSGTLGQATNTSLSPSQEAASSPGAEVFIMTPEAWLTSDFVGNGSFDSVTTLPPIL